MKGIAFAVMMALCGVSEAKGDALTAEMNRIGKLDIYNLCYETQMAEFNGDTLRYTMGIYELSARKIPVMEPDCVEGRADFFSDMADIEESINGYEGE
ncbi:MAG: hypothetical protein ACRCXB_04255 [Aeromonadaceae bacterium]